MDFAPMKNFMDHLTDWIIPGNSIVVYHKNKEVFRYSSGYSDLENNIPMSGDELLNIYSCSKVATVVAALQLYEQGKFLLDDPLYNYISEYKDMYIKGENGELVKAKNPITLRHLFTHTSGMTYNIKCNNIKDVIEKTDGRAPTIEIVKAFAKEPLMFEPGDKWSYSFAHDVLGAVVEVISGKRFSQYVTENIFEPVGINDAYYYRNDDIRARMATQYNYIVGEPTDDIVKMQMKSESEKGYIVNRGKDNSHIHGTEYDSGGAGIVTTVSSYAKFANALAMGGRTQSGEQILSKNTLDLLRTNQLTNAQLDYFNWSQLKGYGMGLGVRTLIDKAKGGSNGALGEFGWGGAAGATILVDMDNEFSYFYSHHMTNPQEDYYQPRLRNVAYNCISR